MRSFVVASSLVAVVAAATQQSAFIPTTGISQACTTFLNTMDGDSGLSACANSLVSVTKTFTNSTANATSADVSSALTSICTANATSACSPTLMRTQLAAFQAACQNEITTNSNVTLLYDIIYTLSPMQTALCLKDVGGNWCSMSTAANHTVTLSAIAQPIGDASTGAVQINADYWASSYMAFLQINPSESAAQLCTQCTKLTLTGYMEWETSTPYGPGFTHSQLLSQQPTLVAAVNDKCGADFLGDVSSVANSVAGAVSTGSGAISIGANTGFFTAAAAAVVGMVVLL